jgi:hypothetical protein
VRLVLGVQQLFCTPAVLGAEAALHGRFIVLPVEDAVRSLEQPVFVKHGVISGWRPSAKFIKKLNFNQLSGGS